MNELATSIVLSIIGGGSFLTFLQFLINRQDGHSEKKNEILNEIKSVRKEVGEFKEEAEERFDVMDRKIDDSKAIQARARVLRFNDEVQTGRMFSRSAWAQTQRDIADYEAHCDKYDDFPNGEADSAIENLRHVYAELLVHERRGETVFL